MAAEERFIPADPSERIARFFAWWTRDHTLATKFAAVRIAAGSAEHLRALAGHAGPVVAVCNHVSWWDPLVMFNLHRLFWEGRSLRAPMDAAQLERFRFFAKLGVFGIDPDDPGSLELMASYVGEYFANESSPTLWINAQGRFADVREPIEVRPGAARIAASDARTRVVSVSMEYPFWLDPKPELLLRVEPIETDRATTSGWLRAMREAVNRNAAALAGLAIARDPAAFERLIGGGLPKMNPIYDLWLKLRGKAGSLDDRRDRREARAAERRRAGEAGKSAESAREGAAA